MPKVLITAAKGLHQVAGSATMLGQRRHIIQLTNTDVIARTLTVDESGALVLITPSTASKDSVITLPAPTAGVNFDFIITADAGNASSDVTIKTTADAVFIIGILDATDGSEELAASTSLIKFDSSDATTFGSSRLSLVSDGSHWYVREASVNAAKAKITQGGDTVNTSTSV